LAEAVQSEAPVVSVDTESTAPSTKPPTKKKKKGKKGGAKDHEEDEAEEVKLIDIQEYERKMELKI
jgi:hypothetical protein